MGLASARTCLFSNYHEIVTTEEAERYWPSFRRRQPENVVLIAQAS
jgi:hypothetical protein